MVVLGTDRREEFANGDVLSIDRGTAQGVTAGARIVIYRDRRNGGPLVELGEGHVVAVGADSAKVLVTKTIDGVRRGDFVMVRGTR